MLQLQLTAAYHWRNSVFIDCWFCLLVVVHSLHSTRIYSTLVIGCAVAAAAYCRCCYLLLLTDDDDDQRVLHKITWVGFINLIRSDMMRRDDFLSDGNNHQWIQIHKSQSDYKEFIQDSLTNYSNQINCHLLRQLTLRSGDNKRVGQWIVHTDCAKKKTKKKKKWNKTLMVIIDRVSTWRGAQSTAEMRKNTKCRSSFCDSHSSWLFFRLLNYDNYILYASLLLCPSTSHTIQQIIEAHIIKCKKGEELTVIDKATTNKSLSNGL